MKRTDIHRPSAINPSEYEFVGQECFKIQGIGDCQAVLQERARIQAHKARTGGHYSDHEHGGNCMVCGSVNAIYTVLFYHAKTNTYVRMGSDCAAKCEMGGDFGTTSNFRRAVENAREAIAGKNKTIALLSDYGLSRCWDIYNAPFETKRWEENTITDIVGKFVKYGSISKAQQDFLKSLLSKIDNRAAVQAKREVEKAAAADCPKGRVKVEGVILKIRTDDTYYGPTTKMLVKATEGYLVWGTRPSGIGWQKVGDKVRFTASVTPFNDDPKFGFFKRPTNAMLLEEGWTAPTFDVFMEFKAGSETAKLVEAAF
jgi:hypothetical protein